MKNHSSFLKLAAFLTNCKHEDRLDGIPFLYAEFELYLDVHNFILLNWGQNEMLCWYQDHVSVARDVSSFNFGSNKNPTSIFQI